MATSVVQARGLGKRYRVGLSTEPYGTLRGALSSAFRSRGRNRAQTSEIWALRDVDLEVDEGEVVGIIGRNGAGKSTFLKLLARITEPTTGLIRHRGRIGALLEVGTGFHPELTGRENVFLNGAILGMRRAEIDRKLDQIVDFSGVERFIDTPVKRYSSGMHMRLAFAVAAHVEPEILIVDEVLAVGDVEFQRKCIGRMSDVAREGRTVLFVSHNTTAVESLCERVCWIEGGGIADDGLPGEVVSRYLQLAAHQVTHREWEDPATAPASDWVRLRRATVYPAGGTTADPVTVRTPFVVEFEYENLMPDTHLNLSLHLYSGDGVLVLNAVPVNEDTWFGHPYPAGRFRDRCWIPGSLLNDGSYRIELLVVKDQSHVVFKDTEVLEFDVHDVAQSGGVLEGEWSGVVRPDIAWQTDRVG